WPDVIRAVARPAWLEDPRYATLVLRWEHSAELVAELDAIFATKPLAEWAEIFDREDVWWAPVQDAHETLLDPQARAAGGIVDVPNGDDPVEMVATPVDFGGTPWAPRSMPPEAGQHTEEILVELGYDWDRIIELKDTGAIP
ncbi:MAG: CoA transferase, partial [Acidimicrobiales bacterium]